MYRCGVCCVTFQGLFTEAISTTPCGHVFHSTCILSCIKKSSKCPFCTLHVEKHQLIKLQFQIDPDWQQTLADLKANPNGSLINLDDTTNETINLSSVSLEDATDTQKTIPELEISKASISIINLDDTQNSVAVCSEDAVLGLNAKKSNNTKTLLTTSIYTGLLPNEIEIFLQYFFSIIPNSHIRIRSLHSEKNLTDTAVNEGFCYILLINMHIGRPHGLTFYNLLRCKKVYVPVIAFKFDRFTNLTQENRATKIVIKHDYKNSIENFILMFFLTIIPNESNIQKDDTIVLESCDNCQALKFVHSSAGLKFCMLSCPE